MKTQIPIVCAVLLAACASAPEQQETREYRNFEWAESYRLYRRACRSAGGVIVIAGSASRFTKNGVPNYGDLYHCQKSWNHR